MELMTRDAILSAQDLIYEDVPVPEWKGTVRVTALSSAARDAFEASIVRETREGKKTVRSVNMENARAKFCALAITDQDGTPLFSLADTVALGRKNGQAMQRLFEVGLRISGMTEEEIEELGKDSGSGQSDGSNSDSPVTSEKPLANSTAS